MAMYVNWIIRQNAFTKNTDAAELCLYLPIYANHNYFT